MNVNRALRRAAVATGVVAGFVLGSGVSRAPANRLFRRASERLSAARPTRCAPGDVGQLISGFAQAPDTAHPGLGDGIQELQAGLVPDEVAVNTCNG